MLQSHLGNGEESNEQYEYVHDLGGTIVDVEANQYEPMPCQNMEVLSCESQIAQTPSQPVDETSIGISVAETVRKMNSYIISTTTNDVKSQVSI